jgi:putative ABC transport system permease protein
MLGKPGGYLRKPAAIGRSPVQNPGEIMGAIGQDLKYGARVLLKSPGVTVVAVLTLALGIGANSAIFSVVNAVLLKPLPYEEADRLVFLTEWSRQVPNMSFSVANFKDVRDQNRVFDGIVAFRSQNFVMTGAGEAERLAGRQATHGLFRTLRLKPVLGREFTEEEDKVGAEPVVLLGEGFWDRRFGRDPNILGRQLVLNGESYTVIGVLPTNMHGTFRLADVWTPLLRLEDQLGGPSRRGNHPGIYVAGRLKPGITVEQARTEVTGIARRLAEQYPNSNSRQSMTVEPLLKAVVGDLRPALLVLLGAVVFVLLIACSNVANLLLARATVRQREIAVRTALGAGRLRIVRQLLTESILLSVTGGVVGMLLSFAGVKGLVAITPKNTPRFNEIRVDWTVLLFTMLLSVATGLIFGLFPAVQATKPDSGEALKEGGRGASAGRGRHRVRNALVVAEVSLALVLLVGAGLMLRSFLRVLEADPGFRPEKVLTMNISLPQVKYGEPAKIRTFYQQVLERVRAIPGVEMPATTLPLLGGWQTSFMVEGQPEPPQGQMPSTDIARVSPDFHRAIGIRLLKGRYFTDQDTDGRPLVCIVDETMAQAYWPGEDALGRKLKFGRDPNSPWLTVVGVVGHVKNYGVDQESRVETYVPLMQNPNGAATLVVRTATDPTAVTAAIRKAVLSVDPEVPVYSVQPLAEILSNSRAQRRMAAQLLAVFSALALVLAAIGIYGVMSYSVTQRTHEIGIRLALGARENDIMRMVLGRGMVLTAVGVVIGMLMAFGMSISLVRATATILFRVSSTDPPTFASTPILLILVALLACYIPARRALRVEPMTALREE